MRISIVVFILFLPVVTSAQIQLGFNAGYTNTTINGPMTDHYTSRSDDGVTRRAGFNLGVALRWRLSEIFHLETGAAFFQKGGAVYKSGFVDDLKMTGNYLDIPLVAGIRTKGRTFHLTAEGGMSYGS